MALAFSAVTGSTNSTAAMVVGTGSSLTTSGSGTLTAKAFSGVLPLANGGRTALDNQRATSTLTGDSTDQLVFTYTLPGGTIAAGEGIRIMSRWAAAGATSTSYILSFGGTQIGTATTAVAGSMNMFGAIFNKPGLTNAQVFMGKLFVSNNPVGFTYTDAAIDSTAPIVITLTFNVANTVTITTRLWEVTIIH